VQAELSTVELARHGPCVSFVPTNGCRSAFGVVPDHEGKCSSSAELSCGHDSREKRLDRSSAMAMNADRSRIVLDLFDKFYSRVYCFARRSVTSDLAEDIAQDVFIRLLEHKNLEKLEISVSYLLKIADNLIKRRWQREQRFGRYQERVRTEQQPTPPSKREHSSIIMDDEEVNEALSELSERERAAVELIICNDLSYEEAAESLGVRVTTVNNWKYRGLQKLKYMSEQQGADRHPKRLDPAPCRSAGEQSVRSRAADTHHADSLLHPEHPDYGRRRAAVIPTQHDHQHGRRMATRKEVSAVG
jgi:RNA polymerase sigma-70 factor, ECF subfamily